ncbi:hypothetical protein BH10ACI2_BH10ACI2_10070 [soil metagenome]
MFIEDQVAVRSDADTSTDFGGRGAELSVKRDELIVEIGIWLSGLECFLISGHHSFTDRKDRAASDATNEFRLVHSTLQRCSLLIGRIIGIGSTSSEGRGIEPAELIEFQKILRDASMLSGGLIQSSSLGSGEWKAWSRMLSHRFHSSVLFSRLIRQAEIAGEKYLPERLLQLSESHGFLSPEHAELALILPRFGKVLRWLDVVGKMLDADEPLKAAIVVFARINEQINDLSSYINNRLERFPNEEAEMFALLDAASYTASIELKKVYSQELAGLARTRPSPSIYARMETAFALLNESFQQTLATFARVLDPEIDVFQLFPSFKTKLENSKALRRELFAVVKVVQAAEKAPEDRQIGDLHARLRSFMAGTVRYLFYKDTETVERFIEEILVTKQNKDLVPILHRFGAYLETLFGQVNLRAVLAKHPFEQG